LIGAAKTNINGHLAPLKLVALLNHFKGPLHLMKSGIVYGGAVDFWPLIFSIAYVADSFQP
jgi:hypothetical protein